jgi:hypothetical protein
MAYHLSSLISPVITLSRMAKGRYRINTFSSQKDLFNPCSILDSLEPVKDVMHHRLGNVENKIWIDGLNLKRANVSETKQIGQNNDNFDSQLIDG